MSLSERHKPQDPGMKKIRPEDFVEWAILIVIVAVLIGGAFWAKFYFSVMD